MGRPIGSNAVLVDPLEQEYEHISLADVVFRPQALRFCWPRRPAAARVLHQFGCDYAEPVAGADQHRNLPQSEHSADGRGNAVHPRGKRRQARCAEGRRSTGRRPAARRLKPRKRRLKLLADQEAETLEVIEGN